MGSELGVSQSAIACHGWGEPGKASLGTGGLCPAGQYEMPTMGGQGTGLLVLEVGPGWKGSGCSVPPQLEGAAGGVPAPTAAPAWPQGPMPVCPRGGGDPSGLCLSGLCPSPGAMPRDRAACVPLPCCLPPPWGSGLLQRAAAHRARPRAPAYVCSACNSDLIHMANKLQKQLICAAAHTPRSCGSAAWLAAVPPHVPSPCSEHGRSVPPSAQVLKY